MIGRLLYHVFWNFYDYLGSYLLIGAISCLPLFLLVYVLAAFSSFFVSGVAGIIVLILLLLLLGACVAAVVAGTLNFATVAARDDPARFPHFKTGAKQLLKPVGKVVFVVALAYGIDVVAAWFYLMLSGRMGPGTLRLIVFVLGILFAWLAILGSFYTLALMGAVGRAPALSFRQHVRRAFIAFVVAPVLWIPAGIMFFAATALCIVSVVGVVFWIPITATIAATAMAMSASYIEVLSATKEQKPDATPRQLRLAAVEGFLDAEAAKPQRTLRELIRPWEM